VRMTSVLRKLLGTKHLVVRNARAEDGELVVEVRPSWRVARCSRCHRRVWTVYDHQELRRWRHLDFGAFCVQLEYRPRRVPCPCCGVVVEQMPWSDEPRSQFTMDFEDQVTYLAQRVDKSSIEQLMRIAWRTVGRIVERVVAKRRPADPLGNLEYIGVDELSYRKQHHYVTVVVDHRNQRVVWGGEGKSAESLLAFFEQLGPERCKAIKVVTMDMSAAFIKAVREAVPDAQIVFDRFHVQQLVSQAVEKVRREQWGRLRHVDGPAAKALKKTRWALLRNPWNLTPSDEDKLAALQVHNKGLYRAYLLKESFAAIMDRLQPNVVRRMLLDWLAWASRCRLAPFVRVARTIRKHLDDIVAYVRCRLTNGLVEGFNTKARLATRRAFGFHSAQAVLAMIMLCCSGLHLAPVTKRLSR
jgi:transposase